MDSASAQVRIMQQQAALQRSSSSTSKKQHQQQQLCVLSLLLFERGCEHEASSGKHCCCRFGILDALLAWRGFKQAPPTDAGNKAAAEAVSCGFGLWLSGHHGDVWVFGDDDTVMVNRLSYAVLHEYACKASESVGLVSYLHDGGVRAYYAVLHSADAVRTKHG